MSPRHVTVFISLSLWTLSRIRFTSNGCQWNIRRGGGGGGGGVCRQHRHMLFIRTNMCERGLVGASRKQTILPSNTCHGWSKRKPYKDGPSIMRGLLDQSLPLLHWHFLAVHGCVEALSYTARKHRDGQKFGLECEQAMKSPWSKLTVIHSSICRAISRHRCAPMEDYRVLTDMPIWSNIEVPVIFRGWWAGGLEGGCIVQLSTPTHLQPLRPRKLPPCLACRHRGRRPPTPTHPHPPPPPPHVYD